MLVTFSLTKTETKLLFFNSLFTEIYAHLDVYVCMLLVIMFILKVFWQSGPSLTIIIMKCERVDTAAGQATYSTGPPVAVAVGGLHPPINAVPPLSALPGMFAIRNEREWVVSEDFMKAVRKISDNKKLETKMDYKQI